MPRALSLSLVALAACWPALDDLGKVTVPADAGSSADVDTAPGAYVAAVMADAPLAYFRLSEAQGNVALDASGHGNDATFDGPIQRIASGVFAGDGAVALAGNARIDVGDRFAFGSADDFTIEAWIRPGAAAAEDTGFRRIAERETLGPETGYDLFFRGAADPRLGFARIVGAETREGVYAPAAFVVATTKFTHVVVVSRGAAELRLFVDGALVDAKPVATVAPPVVGARFYFGGSVGGSGFIGALDELAVYGSALTDARVKAHFDAATR